MNNQPSREFAVNAANAIDHILKKLGPISKDTIRDFIHDLAVVPAVEAATKELQAKFDRTMSRIIENMNSDNTTLKAELATAKAEIVALETFSGSGKIEDPDDIDPETGQPFRTMTRPSMLAAVRRLLEEKATAKADGARDMRKRAAEILEGDAAEDKEFCEKADARVSRYVGDSDEVNRTEAIYERVFSLANMIRALPLSDDDVDDTEQMLREVFGGPVQARNPITPEIRERILKLTDDDGEVE